MVVSFKSHIHFMAMASVSLLSLASAAQAQDAATDSSAEIVVTAKNRVEKLQDVPLSITSLNQASLIDNQVRDVKDLQKITPNLSLFSGSGRNDPSGWALRGLTSNTSDERYQGISFFLDGVAVSGQLASIDTDNVDRVEIIKGPQAATFGRATYSGAINFVTKEPSGDQITGAVRVRGSAFKDSNEPSYFLNASLTIPLVKDQLWLSAAGTTMRNGAVTTAVDSGQPIGRERTDSGTATLSWKPDSSFSVRLRGLYTHDRDSIAAQILEQPRDWLQAGVPTVALPRGSGSFLPSYLPDPDVDLTADKGRWGYRRDRYFGSLIISKKFGDYELSYRGGYFKSVDARDAQTFPRSTVPGQDPVFGSVSSAPCAVTAGQPAPKLSDPACVSAVGNSFTTSSETFENTSHQLVLLSPGNKPFRWRVGGYYFWEKDTSAFASFATVANPSGLASVQSFTNVAGFGGFDWEFLHGLTLSGEGRYARETLKYPACLLCVPSPNLTDASRASDTFSPRVTVNYKIAPNNMVYALYSNGTKSGRFSNITPPGGVQTIIYAQPEKLDNFEVGTKNTFLNGRITLNLSAFFDKVRQQQLTSTTVYTFVNAAGNTVTSNITATNNVGKSEIKGFELETRFQATRRFSVEGSVGYAKQKFTNTAPVLLQASSSVGFPGAVGSAVVIAGKTQANVPWWNGYAAAQYVIPLDHASIKFRLDAVYRGKLYADLANLTEIKSAWTLNGRIALTQGTWETAFFARNILNNQRATGSGLAGATATCGFTERNTATYGSNQQCLYASPPRPLELGVEASYKF